MDSKDQAQQEVALLEVGQNQGITARDIENRISKIVLNKQSSMEIVTLFKLLEGKAEEAKQYLLTKCDKCDVLSSGQLSLSVINGQKTMYTNATIEKLKEKIKKEEEKIKKDNTLGEVKIIPYTSLRVKK